MNNKGFLLIDSLVNTLIVSLMCLLCLMTYNSLKNYDEGYFKYEEESNEKYDSLYSSLSDCVKCEVIESEEEWSET